MIITWKKLKSLAIAGIVTAVSVTQASAETGNRRYSCIPSEHVTESHHIAAGITRMLWEKQAMAGKVVTSEMMSDPMMETATKAVHYAKGVNVSEFSAGLVKSWMENHRKMATPAERSLMNQVKRSMKLSNIPAPPDASKILVTTEISRFSPRIIERVAEDWSNQVECPVHPEKRPVKSLRPPAS